VHRGDDLTAAAASVEIVDGETVTIAGRAHPLRADAEAELSALIYRWLYVRPSGPERIAPDPCSVRDFQSSLLRAHGQAEVWSPGWQLDGEDGDRLVVARGRLRFWADPRAVKAGADRDCEVRVPGAHLHLLPGYHLVLGGGPWGSLADAAPVVRLYWHLRSRTAPHLVKAIGEGLRHIPYRLKVLRDPAEYRRADAGVLYLPAHCFDLAGETIAEIHLRLRHELRGEVPLFTRALGSGLGLAEDPGDLHSFGQHRCDLVARGLLAAHRQGDDDVRSKREAIAQEFRAQDLDPDTPYLGAGSADRYRLPPATPRRTRRPAARTSMLDAAIAIGQALCGSAHWDADNRRCTWFGRINSTSGLPRSAALGADFYQGLSGVAVFLAELSAATGAGEFADAARAAMTCAVEQTPPPEGGLYSGSTGVAFARRRLATLLGDEPGDLDLGDLHTDSYDLVAGKAGIVLALLEPAGPAKRTGLQDTAIRLGEGLCEDWSHAAAATDPPALTGLSHGAAGVGIALLELAAATGRIDFQAAGRAAFAYEDALFDADHGNWPDLRDPRSPRFMTAWCHGAPGIALARLRAARADPDHAGIYAARARDALATTQAALKARVPLDAYDATACHGSAGLIEALSIGGTLLGEPGFSATADEAAGVLALTAVRELRSGTRCGGPNPSFMLGTAGLGYQFLRLHNPATPSLLAGPWHVPAKAGTKACAVRKPGTG
jgi:hypothetical protein